MTFDQWWATLTHKEQLVLGLNNAKFVWDAGRNNLKADIFVTVNEFLGAEKERHAMFSEGYDHALRHIEEYVKGRT